MELFNFVVTAGQFGNARIEKCFIYTKAYILYQSNYFIMIPISLDMSHI